MWTCLSTAPGSAVESTARREACQSVLGEWPCLNKCEEWITLDKLDFICAPVAQNLLQTEPNLVKVFFGCWLLTAAGIQLAGMWNQGSGQWICWSERRQQPKEAGTLPELQEMQRSGGRNKLFWVVWHCKFTCSFTSKAKETATLWISPGKAVLTPCCSSLHLLNYVKRFGSSLVLVSVATRFDSFII